MNEYQAAKEILASLIRETRRAWQTEGADGYRRAEYLGAAFGKIVTMADRVAELEAENQRLTARSTGEDGMKLLKDDYKESERRCVELEQENEKLRAGLEKVRLSLLVIETYGDGDMPAKAVREDIRAALDLAGVDHG